MAEKNGEVVKYQANAPVGSAGTLKALLERQLPALRAVVPQGVTADRLMRMMLVAVNKQPDLLSCTQESVLKALSDAAALGLDIGGATGEAYAVPFSNTIKVGNKQVKVRQATMIPGYRGLQKLARQSGEVGRIDAEAVRERDHFVYEKGTNFKVEFRPRLDGQDRGPVVGYYCLIMSRDGATPIAADFMTLAEVKKVQSMAKSGGSPAWRDHFDEMGRKTVFRRAVKWAPISEDKFQKALEADNQDYDLDEAIQVIEIAPGESRADALADKLTGEDGEVEEGEATDGEADLF